MNPRLEEAFILWWPTLNPQHSSTCHSFCLRRRFGHATLPGPAELARLHCSVQGPAYLQEPQQPGEWDQWADPAFKSFDKCLEAYHSCSPHIELLLSYQSFQKSIIISYPCFWGFQRSQLLSDFLVSAWDSRITVGSGGGGRWGQVRRTAKKRNEREM